MLDSTMNLLSISRAIVYYIISWQLLVTYVRKHVKIIKINNTVIKIAGNLSNIHV